MNDKKLYNYIKEFVFKLHPLIQPAIDKKYITPFYEKYPSVNYNENGMPNITEFSYERPYKIDEIFQGYENINLNDFEEFNNLSNYLINHNKFKSRIINTEVHNEGFFESLINFSAKQLSINILERYFLLNKINSKNEKLLESIYIEYENFLYADSLKFDISTPILFINFTFDEFHISENISIRKISDEFHKSRFKVKSYSPAILDPIISSATHELVLKNYHIKNELGRFYTYSNLDYESAYPINKFELFFNSIKIVTNHNSGFSQILVYPKDWSDIFNMDLPRLKGISVKKYPNYFDDFYWTNKKLPTINEKEISEISEVYKNLMKNDNNKIQISNRRLRNSYLRDNEEDSILDIIIALETLLSDNEKSELTYKLSMRISKLLGHFNKNYNSIDIFNLMKKIYDYRSAVVHGSSKVDSKKEIKIDNKKPIKTIALANDYLREIIRILIENPKYLNPKEIDILILNE